MKKYIIIIFVIFVAGLFIRFLVQNRSSLINDQINDVGSVVSPLSIHTDNKNSLSQTVTEDNKNINNQDNKNITKKMINATLNTNKGSITIEFFDKDAPKAVANFIKLAGDKFYDGVKFHRVIKDFMIQGGDPLTKDNSKMAMWGTGDPGYKFADEIDPKSDLYTKVGYSRGIVAMANSGPNTNGSQFFIMHADYPLPPLYVIFGKVVSGQDVVDIIGNVKTGAGDRPIDPVIITSITLK